RAGPGKTYRSLLANDGTFVFGSDWPSGQIDPRLGMDAAVNPTGRDGLAPSTTDADDEVSLDRVLAAYTSQAAWASFDEQRKGRLAPDMLADIVVLSKDILTLDPGRLTDAEVAFTIFDGNVVYERQVRTTEQ
ncbi:MAG: amidohydrolase family protein, partial [Acidobacteria bacterium]|nr:amidohydrolase family protein [Acidobacteriota bacterium]